ncbi:MAG: 50S ribosomal protein L9 [Rhodospirillales bacterium]|nr:50S ribosomal protein L9 [Rhodospirillales bacterium]
MDVILLERIEKLGQMGEVVKVKPGYARNFLLPQRKALRATKDNLVIFEKQRAQLEAVNLQRRQEAEAVAAKMDGLSIVMIRQAAEGGSLYGSVSGRDVADAIKEAGFTVSRQQVHLDVPIKTLGRVPVRVALHPEVAVTVNVVIARTQDEATRATAAAEPEEAPEPAEAGEAATEE